MCKYHGMILFSGVLVPALLHVSELFKGPWQQKPLLTKQLLNYHLEREGLLTYY